MFSSAKHPVLTGTAILTCAGTLSRLIGFFYRIFLSRTIGAQGLGIYQMIFPVYAFCLSGVTAGIQSALSRCCSAALSKGNPRKGWVFFLSGSGLSVGLSLIVSFFLYTRAPWISLHILHEIRCCELLQLLAFSLPLCSIHTCIHAWYFSTRRTTVPGCITITGTVCPGGCFLCHLPDFPGAKPCSDTDSRRWRHAFRRTGGMLLLRCLSRFPETFL